MQPSPSQAPALEHADPDGGAWVVEESVKVVNDEVELEDSGVAVAVGNVGFVTGLPSIEISEHALNVSCGPHPSFPDPDPSPHHPQLFPVV